MAFRRSDQYLGFLNGQGLDPDPSQFHPDFTITERQYIRDEDPDPESCTSLNILDNFFNLFCFILLLSDVPCKP